MSRTRSIFWLFLGLGWGVVAHATTAEPEKSAPAAEAAVIYPRSATESRPEAAAAGRGSGYSAITVAALLLVGAGIWVYWRGRGAPGVAGTARKLVIAETKSLGNRQYLVVASYEDKKFLLSVCPGKIEMLTTLENTSSPKSA